MTLTFLSKSLDRLVAFETLAYMSQLELQTFHSELVVAGDSMQMALKAREESSVPVDPDWVHKIKTKMQACETFRSQIEQMLDTARTSGNGTVKQLIDQKLEQLLIDELGERLYKELQAEARDLVLEDLQVRTPGA